MKRSCAPSYAQAAGGWNGLTIETRTPFRSLTRLTTCPQGCLLGSTTGVHPEMTACLKLASTSALVKARTRKFDLAKVGQKCCQVFAPDSIAIYNRTVNEDGR